jgi:hypothetical protein
MFTSVQKPFVLFLANLVAGMATALFPMSVSVPATGVVTCATLVSLDGRALTAHSPHAVWAVS